MNSIIVLGDGAVGTAIAVTLSAMNKDVILAGPRGTPERRRLCSTVGYLSQSAEITHTAIDRITHRGKVVVALKAFSIKNAVSYMKNFCVGTPICLSNGMGLNEEWGESISEIEYAVLSIGFRKTGPFTVSTSDGLLYCSKGGEAAELFASSLISPCEVLDIDTFRWAKWYANSIINPIAALSGLANNRLKGAGLRPLIDTLSLEVSQLLPTDDALTEGNRILEWLLENSPNRCSMLQDREKGQKTEIEFLTGLCREKLPDRCPTANTLISLIEASTRI